MAREKISVDKLSGAVESLLAEYAGVVNKSADDAIDDAAEYVKDIAVGETVDKWHDYARGWEVKEKEFPRHRYIANSRTAKGKKSESIPLTNILEFGTVTRKTDSGANRGEMSPRPHLDEITKKSTTGVVEILIKELSK